jgi:hypothetical protein
MDIEKYYIRDCLKHNVFDLIHKDYIFEKDNELYREFRLFIDNFIKSTIQSHNDCTILEIGPKNYKPNKLLTINNNSIETVDIIENNMTTYVCDLTKANNIPKLHFDSIYCLEVIEHCSSPLDLLRELFLLLKNNGTLYLSFPFQFRLHGPLPDNWRISEFGIRQLLADTGFKIIKMDALIEKDRPAFPVSYTIICHKT